MILRPAIFDRDVLAFAIAGLGKTLMEARQIGRHAGRRAAVEEAHDR